MEEMLEWVQLLLIMAIIVDAIVKEARCRFFSYDFLVLYYFPEVMNSGYCIWASVPCVVLCTALLLFWYSDLADLYVLNL